MDNLQKEKIRLTTKEILLNFCDGIAKIHEFFGYSWQKREAFEYQNWRKIDKDNYYKKLWNLEKQGYIQRYKKDKKTIIKLTKMGEQRALHYLTGEFKIQKPKLWDKKWRIVIFDIPENKKIAREVVRENLQRLGFYQLQKSVFVYPYECQELVAALKYTYEINDYLQYIIAESIETEIDLVGYFFDKKIIDKNS